MNSIEKIDNLTKEQNKIINSKDNNIIVVAGPGSGKTHTLIKKTINELKKLDETQGVILCSFTNEASKQLKDKLEKQTDIKASVICTLDAFVMNLIKTYRGRYFKVEMNAQNLKIVFPGYKDKVSGITKYGFRKENKKHIMDEINRYKELLLSDIYEVSFPSYIVAIEIIKKLDYIRKYYELKYHMICIDEAQDLNDFQLYFVKQFSTLCHLKCILIGDDKQSIYSFRGAKPEKFVQLEKEGFVKYEITYSLRCHDSIYTFCNNILSNNKKPIDSNDNRVHILNKKEFDNAIINETNDYLILTETNDRALDLYNFYKNKVNNLFLTKSISFSNKDFNDNYLPIIEECIKYYLNVKNIDPKCTYSASKIENFILDFRTIDKKTKGLIANPGNSCLEFVYKILENLDIVFTNTEKKELEKMLSDGIYYCHYLIRNDINRIMTIHSSKGLEANSIYVYLENYSTIDNEYLRKLFVAFSRAKENLYIYFSDDNMNIKKLLFDSLYIK